MADPTDTPQEAPAATDRRTAQRHPSDLVIAVHPLILPKKEAVAAMVKDISTHGISLVLRVRFAPGTVLVLDIDAVTDGGARPLLGRVVHATSRGDGKWVHGCALRRPLSAEQVAACRTAASGDARVRTARAEDAVGA